jgi:hypothetical protein
MKDKIEDNKAYGIAHSLYRQSYKKTEGIKTEGNIPVYMTHKNVMNLSFKDVQSNIQKFKNNPE